MALADAFLLVDDVEDGSHWLVVGDAYGVVAFDDAMQFVGRLHGLFLYDLIVLDDVEHHLWSYYRQTGNLIIGEKLVANFDDTLYLDLF